MLERQTWAFLGLYFVLALAIEAMLARWIWMVTAQPPRLRIGRWVALGLGTCVVVSQFIHAWALPNYYVPVTAFTRYLPLYRPLQDTGLLVKLGLVDRNRAREQGVIAAVNRPPGRVLSYPLAPLHCEPPKPALNVLLLVIDALRADAVTPDLAPRLSHFKQSAISFDAHYSGGNSSRAGMFSIFYGLPGTYWEDFADVARPPVVMDLFRKYDYELGVFASAPVYRTFLGLDRTALARIPNLRLETSSSLPGSSGWDRTVTDEWYAWLSKRDPSRPFFGFLYYDAVVSSDAPPGYPLAVRVPPSASRQVLAKARYLTAVHFDDALVGEVLDDLARRQLLQSTIIIVTSDHGMEFDENGLGFTGHGTAFSDYQLHTPLLVHWPGRPPGRVVRRTSHNDLAPTLVSELFRCTNPPSDYASGHSLFSDVQWDWLIAASYTAFALLQPDQVTVVYPAGYEVRDREYRLIPRPTFPQDALRAALREMRRFYQ
jgi:membrane-anchored protein YejM (alkaline phosphatase superfamily)